jgi:hypothetical protein
MHHIVPVYTQHSDAGGLPLPMQRDPTRRSEAVKGSRSWFAPPQGTVKSHLVGMLAEFVGSTLSLLPSVRPVLTLTTDSYPVCRSLPSCPQTRLTPARSFLFLALGGAQVASTAVISTPAGAARSGAVDSVAAVPSTSNLFVLFLFPFSATVLTLFGPTQPLHRLLLRYQPQCLCIRLWPFVRGSPQPRRLLGTLDLGNDEATSSGVALVRTVCGRDSGSGSRLWTFAWCVVAPSQPLLVSTSDAILVRKPVF